MRVPGGSGAPGGKTLRDRGPDDDIRSKRLITKPGPPSPMADHKWTMYIPVLVVMILAVPLVHMAQWSDFERSRELASEVLDTSGTFRGFTEDTSTTVTLVPESVIDSTISGSREKVNVTDSSGNVTTISQDSPRKSVLGGLLNALLMVAVAILAAFGIYRLFIRRKKLTLKLFFLSALWLCGTVSIILFLYLFHDYLSDAVGLSIPLNTLAYIVMAAMGISGGTYIAYNMVIKAREPGRKNPALLAFCILLGAFLVIVLPVWVIIPLLTAIAVWDLWAAKRGIIKDMITESDREKDSIIRQRRRAEEETMRREASLTPSSNPVPGIMSPKAGPSGGGRKDVGFPRGNGRDPEGSGKGKKTRTKGGFLDVAPGEDITSYGLFEGKYYSLGLGDFIFFAVLVSAVFKWMMLKVPWLEFYLPGWGELLVMTATALTGALVLLGLKKTLGYLDRESVMPGLPLSILFGLFGFFSTVIFLQALNLIFYGTVVNPF